MANNPNDQSGSSSEQMEREGIESEPNREDSELVTNRSSEASDEQFEDVDPDSAESDVDRDDTIDEP
jgi:hypothetical protein